ncbi:HD-GYP domain-containing protein [Halopseudomonas nanhaiensis]|uniref:HD-GYP domain-containing protein n=1 Tax=Halopseudomonas nanhaiensis TaxID=2830842 RepID=UPI001CBD0B28|nr:HD-GYP domain-containing protein [Halopseudomonas nanhaiensis]UAW99326.1 HD-GYP domain-containing protein [Halopseudomonas nanhaiensis]
MLKTILTRQARVGMYVHEFCGSWLHHPFWSRRFLIKDQKMLQKILDSHVRELIIDTAKGVDLAEPPVSETDTCAVQDSGMENAGCLDEPEPAPAAATERSLSACSVADEMQRARRIVQKGKRAVIDMFTDVRMGRAIAADGLVELMDDMSASIARNPHALISLARFKRRDEYTYLHSVAVAALMIGLARKCDFDDDQVRRAGLAGLLHDLGKAAMPADILNKPGRLTEAEFAIMRTHPVEGYRLLQPWPELPADVLDVCLYHHEKVDGSGYPNKLAGDDIPLLARMGAICDVYDAITSNRPYKSGWDPAESLSQMTSWKGHFDATLLRLFMQMLGIYPVGSLVRLSSDRLAVVVEQSENSLLTPKLSVFYSIKLRQALPAKLLDLSQPAVKEVIVSRESPEQWGFTGLEKLWLAD